MKFYCIKQHDETDCGAACLATVSKQYGLRLPVSKIRELAGTDKQGTTVYGMVKAAEQLGFTAKGVKGGANTIFEQFPLPAIAHIVTEGNLLHYVVIHKITRKEITVADPAKGLVKMSPARFQAMWTGVLIMLVPEHTFEKGNENKNIFQRFFHLLKPQKGLLANIFVASLIITVMGMAGAFFFQIIIDDLLPGNLLKTLNVLGIGIILLNLFQVLITAFRSQLLLHLSQKLDLDLLLGYYQHVLKLPMNFFGARKVGEIISRFQDATSVRDAISSVTLTVMIDTLMAIGGGILLYFQHSTLFLMALIMIIIYGVLVWAFNKRFRRQNKQQMEDNSNLTSYMVESLNGIETIKAFNGERSVQVQTEFKFVRMLRSIFALGTTSNVQDSLKNAVEFIGRTAIIWVGAYLVMQNSITIGNLVSFNALLGYFIDPVKSLINLQPQMQTAIVASERLGEILDLEIEKNDSEQRKSAPDSLLARVQFEDVQFRYGTRRLVLDGINLRIEAGQRVALVGQSGSGKTTLAKLLLNFYQCESGRISIGEYDVKDIQLDYLRSRIAYIPQQTFLFSGSIYDNLTFGVDDATMDDVVRCAKIAQIHEHISSMPLRYDTHLDENGSNLSGGQRQRLSIARALMKNPDILILDEATSNLDAVTEKAIQQTINSMTEGLTSIIIAHRLSTIRSCDKIFVVDEGRVIEEGTHDGLMRAGGYYARLYQSQTDEPLPFEIPAARQPQQLYNYNRPPQQQQGERTPLGEMAAAGTARKSIEKPIYKPYDWGNKR